MIRLTIFEIAKIPLF